MVYLHTTGLLLALTISACAKTPTEPVARYFGEMRWDDGPLKMLPPIRDRQGNVYLAMRENQGLGQTCGLAANYGQAYVGHVEGGFSHGCITQKNARSVHGWVGFGQQDAFIWSGDALVQISAETGSCTRLFSIELTRRDEINMTAVIPWLWDRPAMRTMLALIWVVGDRLPYHAVLDVDRHVYTKHRLFSPRAATDLVAIGAAGNYKARIGAMLLSYADDDGTHIIALFLDENGDETGRIEIPELEAAPAPAGGWQDAARGMPAMTSDGRVAALLSTGQLVFVTAEDSRVSDVTEMTAEGVQLWDDTLWLVGTADGHPALAEIGTDGEVGRMQPWTTSAEAAARIAGSIDVVDERIWPRRVTEWLDSETAFGPAPLVAPHPLLPYQAETVGWVIGGPLIDNGSYRCRSIAFLPVTARYP